MISRATRQSSPVPGETTKDIVETIAQECRMILAEPVVTAACFFAADGAMGETVARHSLRPRFGRGQPLIKASDPIAPQQRGRLRIRLFDNCRTILFRRRTWLQTVASVP
jgi:hypothetical protein